MLDINGNGVKYRRFGSGPDVLLVHGWFLYGQTWRKLVSTLTGYACHVIDLPGAGGSPQGDQPLGFTGQSKILEAVVDELGLEKCALIGNDSGGVASSLFAVRRPDVVSALIIVGSDLPDYTSWLLRMFIIAAKMPGKGLGLKLGLSNRFFRHSTLGLGQLFYDKKNLTSDFQDLFIEPFLNDRPYRVGQTAILANFDRKGLTALGEAQPTITAPTLFVWGNDDVIFPVGRAQKWQSA